MWTKLLLTQKSNKTLSEFVGVLEHVLVVFWRHVATHSAPGFKPTGRLADTDWSALGKLRTEIIIM